jgi:hypothetical protein
MQFALEVVVLECSFVKHIQGILGVNIVIEQTHHLSILLVSKVK